VKYANPGATPIPGRKRCKTRHSPKYRARCRLARDHEGECRFGWYSTGAQKINLDDWPKQHQRIVADVRAAREASET
jgi:hypothetical protein